jgi:SSS family solute:Na+ symporter
MIPAVFIFLYLGIALYIGVFAFRKTHPRTAEDYFLAGRSLGPFVFVLSLFGTHMTAFSILGASGFSFTNGIVTFGLMASSSALVVPVTLFFLGTRMWALGKRHGFFTPVQMFRDRWECAHIGTLIFAVQAALLVPYIIIGVIGGGTTLAVISGGLVPYWMGGALVALVVMSYVFFGGMRGTAWVNTFQTLLFLVFGLVALGTIGAQMGGFEAIMQNLQRSPATAALLTRERISPLFFLSYMFIPLSAIAFPHIGIFCLTARRMTQFRTTAIFYPLCLLAVWLPSVYLGVAANAATEVPEIRAKVEARAALAAPGAALSPEQRRSLSEKARADDVVLLLLGHYAPVWLAGLLGAGIMAAVMASDSQILALSTMFTEDVFAFYGGKERFGEGVQVLTGRVFVIVLTVLAYVIALEAPETIFALAVQYAFTGYAALSPLLVAALFWRGSTKWGALASTVWVALAVIGVAIFQQVVPAPPPGPPSVVWSIGDAALLARTPGGTSVLGFMPVVSITLISALLLVLGSWLTPKPSPATLSRYFSERS